MIKSTPIERLTPDTLIRIGKDAARAASIRFDGYGYAVDLRYGASDDGYAEFMYVDAGGSVEFEGVGEPVLRTNVPFDEIEAKAAALNHLALAGVTATVLGDVLAPYATAAE